MTWHHVRNYGTALQAYALKTVIERAGCSVDLIDYRRNFNNPFKLKSLRSLIWGKLKGIRKKKGKIVDFKNEVFDNFFEKYFTYTSLCRYWQDLNALNYQYDAFVCGSDQIWGPEWLNPVYFLDFVDEEKKRIAYAPSIGVDEIDDAEIFAEMKALISGFSSVSIREAAGCRIVKKMGVQSVCNVLDPVLLLSKEEWESLSKPITNIPKKYAVVFFLKDNERNIKQCLEHLNKASLTPIIFHSTQSYDNNFANFDGCSVEQLLYLINHSEAVYTDSFHITVLSIIFGKTFTLFLKNSANDKFSKNSRLTDLLEKIGLMDCVFDFSKRFDYPINYDVVYAKIDQLRKFSLDYLYDRLEKALESENDNFACSTKCFKCSTQNEKCCGMPNDSFGYIQNVNSFLSRRMKKWGFALDEKCYTCKYLDRTDFYQTDKPLFYKKLNGELEKKKLSLLIYLKYYIAYDLPMLRRKK